MTTNHPSGLSPSRQAITASMKIRKTITVAQAAIIGSCRTKTARDCLARMVREGVAGVDRTGSAFAYFLIENPVKKDPDANRKVERVRQATRQKYPLHHVRDELVAYLFGAPKQHGEMTK